MKWGCYAIHEGPAAADFNCKRGTGSASSNGSVLLAWVGTILLHLATEADAGDRKSANTLRSAEARSLALTLQRHLTTIAVVFHSLPAKTPGTRPLPELRVWLA